MSVSASIRSRRGGGERGGKPASDRSGVGTKITVLLLLVALLLIAFVTGLVRALG